MNPISKIIATIDIKHLTILKAFYPITDSPYPIESIRSCKKANDAPKKSRNTNLILKPTVLFRF